MSFFKRTSPEEEFWIWFQKNDDLLFDFENDQERIFTNLATALRKVHQDLAFEFSAKHDGKREFVISADGLKTAFPTVEALFKAAPILPRWVFVKFRPRRDPGELMIKDVKIGHEDVEIAIEPDGEKVGLNVFVKGFNQEKSRQYTQLVFIFLDHSLGEYDMETKVGFIKIKPFEEASHNKRYDVKVFPAVFDEFVKRPHYKNN